nr:MAG TPA: hypothetical protein [Caudoviricetes sp.]
MLYSALIIVLGVSFRIMLSFSVLWCYIPRNPSRRLFFSNLLYIS